MKVLAVIDMQNDFISGALGTPQAQSIVPNVQNTIQQARSAGELVVFTRDTHTQNYPNTQEGRKLPVAHCLRGTDGWQICSALDVADSPVFDKPGFGSPALLDYLCSLPDLEAVSFVGLCTDICLITNVMMLKGALPELPIRILSSCCAGVTPESHENALRAMQMCQCEIV